MSRLFLEIVNMSICASWLVLAVLLLRFVLKKAPKWLTVALWAVVAVRLICPVSIQSEVSMVPSAQTIPPSVLTDSVPAIHSGVHAINTVVNPMMQRAVISEGSNSLQDWIPVASVLWGVGVLAMLIYGAVSYFRVKRRVRTAVLLRENLYQSETVASPFVLGFLRPKIYLPFRMDESELSHVVAHEQAHIRRRDHWWKPVGFAILAVHWFNPLLWLGYVLLCRDIELACDEKVIKTLSTEERADYSQALLHCSVGRRMIAFCPLAFGEVSVKDRVRSVLSYKKPAFWILLAGILLSIVLAVCFLTNPKDETEPSESTVPVTEEIPPETKVSLGIDSLRKKFPMYFDLETFKGLEVYIWQMAEGSYSCGVLPGVNRNYSHEEIWALHENAASLEEMRAIVAYYLEEDLVRSEDSVAIIPVTMPHSSYHYAINEAYTARLNALFWEDFAITNSYFHSPMIDEATFDIDGDGTEEYCMLHHGPTSGIFTFCVSVYEGEGLEYFNIFTSQWTTVRFARKSDGQTVLLRENADRKSYVSFGIEDGNIVLISDEQDIDYWGEQGVTSMHAPIRLNQRICGNLKTYELTYNEQWLCEGYTYKYRLIIRGRMPNAVADTVYTYLSNLENISFDRAMWASGISSNTKDYFSLEEAVLVDIQTEADTSSP